MKQLNLVFLLFSISLPCLSQNNSFSGLLLDSESNKPVPWAHLLAKENGVGTISSSDGQFSLSIPITTKTLTIFITCIGYKSKSVTLNRESHNVIYLEQEAMLLNEVVVRPIDVSILILNAIKKIPINYTESKTTLTGFYRESLRYDSTRYVYITEGLLKSLKKSYKETNYKGEVKLLRSRKKEFEDSLQTLKSLKFYAGAHSAHEGDIVMMRKEFINAKTVKDYSYEINGTTQLNGKSIYVIVFKPLTSKGLFSGVIYLEADSGVFIGASYSLTETGVKRSQEPFNSSVKLLSGKRVVNYVNIGSKWHLSNTWMETSWLNNRVNDTLFFESEYVTTEIDSMDTVTFDYKTRLQYRDIFVDKVSNFDSAFWNGYTILKENDFIRELHNMDLNSKALSIDFPIKKDTLPTKNKEKGIRNIISRLSYDLGTIFFSSNYPEYSFNTSGNGFLVVANTIDSNQIIFGLNSAFNVSLSNKLSVSIGLASSLNQLQYKNVSLAINYKWQTAIAHRPLKFFAGLSISENDVSLPIGWVQGPVNINGKNLSDRIEVRIQQKFLALQATLKLAIELNRQWDLFASANLLLTLNSSGFLFFKEQDGFFLSRKKSSLKISDSRVDFNSASTLEEMLPSIKPLVFSIGVTYRFIR